MLKTRTETVVEVQDWDKLVQETYGRTYEFQQQEDFRDRGLFHLTVPEEGEDFENDTVPEVVNGSKMGVSFKAWLARDPKQKLDTEDDWDREHGLDMWWKRNFYPDVQMVANDLHAKGLVEAGKYTINIDW